MKLKDKILRALAPKCEKQRREFREGKHMVEAYAEDLIRTISKLEKKQERKPDET